MFKCPAFPRVSSRWATCVVVAGLALLVAWPRYADSRSRSSVAVVFSPSGSKRKIHQAIVKELGQARRSVEVAIFTFTSRDLASALVQAKRNGAKVRVLMDKRTADQFSWSQDDELRKKGIEVKLVRLPGKGIKAAKYHHKYAVIDGATVLTGSFNWTVGADEINYENLLRIRDKGIARLYQQQFERVWRNRKLAVAR